MKLALKASTFIKALTIALLIIISSNIKLFRDKSIESVDKSENGINNSKEDIIKANSDINKADKLEGKDNNNNSITASSNNSNNTTTITNTKNENEPTRTVDCNISSISIPVGTDSPVLTFNARISEEENFNLISLLKSDVNKLNINGVLFHTDNNIVWYKDESLINLKNTRVKDAFSLCRKINKEYLETENVSNNNKKMKLRVLRKLPEGISFKENGSVKGKIINNSESIIKSINKEEESLVSNKEV